MSKKINKEILFIIIAALLFILFTNRGNQSSSSGGFNIGVVQYLEHPALNDAREGFIEALDEMEIDYTIHYLNAQGDISNAIKISEKFAKDEMDLIFAIGTPAAQSAKQVTSTIPILFSAVTDPVESGLVDSWDLAGGNITGTSDRSDVKKQLEMFNQLDPSLKDIGILYSTSESNSLIQLEEAQALAEEVGLNIIPTGISNINDLNKALASLLEKVDAVYVISDNMIASSIELVSNSLIEKNMISISAEESQVSGGILITDSHSYYELGKQTGNLALEILVENKDISKMPVYLPEVTNLIVNEDTLDKLDIDKDIAILEDAIKIK